MTQPDLGDQLYRIEDDLRETWVEDWAEEGVESIETYLGKWIAFYVHIEEIDGRESSSEQTSEQAA
jgi:hypothetical protein